MNQSIVKNIVLLTIILMDIVVGMEFDIFVPSFPQLQHYFNLSPFWVEALLSINFVGYCLGLFFVGGLADRYGRKPILLVGFSIFILGSLSCVWAVSYYFLLVGRFLQGVGIAAPTILSFLIIADSYPLKKQQYLMAMLNGCVNVSVAAAPVIGSYVALYFHWQGNFIVLLGLGFIVFFMTLFFIPMYKLPGIKKTLSFRGYIPLFQSKPLMLLVIHIVFMAVPYWIFVGISPLLYMKGLGVSLAHFGYYQGIIALVFALGSVLFGLIIHEYEQKNILHVANGIFIASFMMIAVIAFFNSTSPMLITFVLIFFSIGQVIPCTILYPLCLNFMPEAKGKIAAVLQVARLILTALSLQLTGFLYQGSFQMIGVILCGFILVASITLFFVIQNRTLMNFSQGVTDNQTDS